MMPDPIPCPIPRQTPHAQAWTRQYRGLIASRGSAVALTREDLAALARGLVEIPAEEMGR